MACGYQGIQRILRSHNMLAEWKKTFLHLVYFSLQLKPKETSAVKKSCHSVEYWAAMPLLELCCCCFPSSMLSTWFAQLNGACQWSQPACQLLVYLRTPGHLSDMHKHAAKTLLLGCCTPQSDLPGGFCKNGNMFKWGRYWMLLCPRLHLSSIPQTNPATTARN